MLIQIIGLPKVGKTIYAKNLASTIENAVILSIDDLKEEFKKNNWSIEKNILNEELEQRAIDLLRNGKTVIFDSCYFLSKQRGPFIKKIKNKTMSECECHFLYETYENVKKVNAMNEEIISEDVYQSILKKFEIPMYSEGWDKIRVFNRFSIKEITYLKIPEMYINYDQGNDHHQFSLGKHMIRCHDLISEDKSEKVKIAALLHDCGKPFTRSKINIKGKEDGKIHYLGHDRVGGYLSLEYLLNQMSTDDALYIAALICHHMEPYTWKDSVNPKKESIWGDEFYQDILEINNADKNAH